MSVVSSRINRGAVLAAAILAIGLIAIWGVGTSRDEGGAAQSALFPEGTLLEGQPPESSSTAESQVAFEWEPAQEFASNLVGELAMQEIRGALASVPNKELLDGVKLGRLLGGSDSPLLHRNGVTVKRDESGLKLELSKELIEAYDRHAAWWLENDEAAQALPKFLARINAALGSDKGAEEIAGLMMWIPLGTPGPVPLEVAEAGMSAFANQSLVVPSVLECASDLGLDMICNCSATGANEPGLGVGEVAVAWVEGRWVWVLPRL